MSNLNKLFLTANTIFLVSLVFSGLFLFKNNQQESYELNQYPKTVCDVVVEQNEKTNLEVFEGKPEVVDFSTNPEAKLYKTTIEEQVSEGANFAGHYTVAAWGCGTECQGFAVIDVANGKIIEYQPQHFLQAAQGLEFSLESNILVFNPRLGIEYAGEAKDLVVDDFNARKGRVYYQLVESTDDTTAYLQQLCIENMYSGLVR